MIEHELKFKGKDIADIFQGMAENKTIDCTVFDTDYYDQDNILLNNGFSFRVRKGGVELKQIHGVRRTEIGYKTDDVRLGFSEVFKHKAAPKVKVDFDKLQHTMTITAARQTCLRPIHLPNGEAEVEAALDHVEYYTASGEQVGEDDELELEIIKMTNPNGSLRVITDHDLQHLQNFTMIGNDIAPQPLSKPERARLYEEIVLRVG